MPEMRELLSDGRVHLVQGPMIRWCVTEKHDGSEQEFVREETKWATSSSRLATLLAKERAGENRRVRLVGRNEAVAAPENSPRLAKRGAESVGEAVG